MQSVDELRDQFRDPRLHFSSTPGGLVSLHAITDAAELKLFTQGAHVAHFRPAGHKPVLFLSEFSSLEPGKPIRGGVPICFPWFGPKSDDPTAPPHGWARLMTWQLVDAGIDLTAHINAELRAVIAPFELTFFVRAGDELQMRLIIHNACDDHSSYEAALHTYLAVGDIRQTRVTGLSRRRYIDKVAGGSQHIQDSRPITFTGETDRVYLDTIQSVVVHDPLLRRRLIIDKDGSRSTVIWNPWVEKSKRMPDFGDDEWPGMLCVETANVGPNRVEIAPRDTLAIEALIRIEAED